MAAEISTSTPFVIGDLASDGHYNGSHAEAVCVDVSEIEVCCYVELLTLLAPFTVCYDTPYP